MSRIADYGWGVGVDSCMAEIGRFFVTRRFLAAAEWKDRDRTSTEVVA